MNCSEDRDMGIFYLSTKFELDQSTNNRDLLSDRNHWKHIHKDKQTHTDRLNLILSPYRIECRVIKDEVQWVLITRNESLWHTEDFPLEQKTWKWKRMKIALYHSQREIHIAADRAATRTSIWILIRRTITRNWHTNTVTHFSTNRNRRCLTRLYQAVDCNSMPITTDLEK